MRKINLAVFIALAISSGLNGVTFDNPAVFGSGITNFSNDNSTFIIADIAGDGFDFGVNSVGATLAKGSFFDDDYIIAYNPVSISGFGSSIPGNATFTLGEGGTAANQQFYVIAFSTKSGDNITITEGDKFDKLEGSDWLIPSNNSDTISFVSGGAGSSFEQLSLANGNNFTVVPEPSTYALFAGILSIGYVVVRRARARA